MKKLPFIIAMLALGSCILIGCDKKSKNEPTTNDPTPSYDDPTPSYNKNMAGKTMTLALSDRNIKIDFTSNTSGSIVIGNQERPYESMKYTQTGELSATLIINGLEHSSSISSLYYVYDFQLALFYIDDNHGTVNGTCVSTNKNNNQVKNVTYTYDTFTVF